MAIFQPAFVLERVGADFTITATVAGDVSAFALEADFRDQVGPDATVTISKTTGAGIVATYSAPNTSVVITLLAADTSALLSGPYVWRLKRTDSGAGFDLIDWSTIWFTPDATSAAPQLVNYSDYVAYSQGFLTETVQDVDAKFYLPLIAAAEAACRRKCGRKFSYGTYTEFLDAPVQGNIWASETPLWSITSINYDPNGGYGQLANTFGSDTLIDPSNYYFRVDRTDSKGHQGEIFATNRTGWNWWSVYGYGGRRAYLPGWLAGRPTPVPGAYKLVYKGGYNLVPGDLKLAVMTLVSQMAQRVPRGMPLQSESGMNYSYSLAPIADELVRLDSVQTLLNGFRRPGTFFG